MLARFIKTNIACFLSYVQDRSKYKFKHYHTLYKYIQNMFPKGELLETKGGGKEEKNDRECIIIK
jgi:hypothetical protein